MHRIDNAGFARLIRAKGFPPTSQDKEGNPITTEECVASVIEHSEKTRKLQEDFMRAAVNYMTCRAYSNKTALEIAIRRLEEHTHG